jgi:steroid 5-alpha reductase family enzyme
MDAFVKIFMIIVGINLSGFLIAYKLQTDKLTDLCYNLSFFLGAGYLFIYSPGSIFHLLLALMIMLWSFRLGAYLFIRVHKVGRDERFDDFRQSFFGFMKFWILQACSILVIILPVFFGLTSESVTLTPISFIGLFIWFVGYQIESFADGQKFRFKSKPENKGKFYGGGLFSVVKYPNYLGEIMCWWGVFIYVIPVLSSWEWLSMVSPLWITALLLWISGIPLLEKQYEIKYGHTAEYQEYQKRVYKLIPGIY